MVTLHYLHTDATRTDDLGRVIRGLRVRLAEDLKIEFGAARAPEVLDPAIRSAHGLGDIINQGASILNEREEPEPWPLLVGCPSNHPIAASCQRVNPCCVWGGALSGKEVAAVWGGGWPAAWHEALHLLGASDCYETSDPGKRRHHCIMQFEPNPRDWLCEKTIAELRKHLSESPTP